MGPLQLTIADAHGLNLASLRVAILAMYHSPNGRRVQIVESKGPGDIPSNVWVLKDKAEVVA